MNSNLNELDSLSELWQAHRDPFKQEQENFMRKLRRRTIQYVFIQCLLVLSTLHTMMWCLVWWWNDEHFLLSLICLLYIPLSAYLGHKMHRSHVIRRFVLPLTPNDYLNTLRHNLNMEVRDLSWTRRGWPWMMAYILMVCAAVLHDTGFKPYCVVSVLILIALLAPTNYAIYVMLPEKHQNALKSLNELSKNLGIL